MKKFAVLAVTGALAVPASAPARPTISLCDNARAGFSVFINRAMGGRLYETLWVTSACSRGAGSYEAAVRVRSSYTMICDATVVAHSTKLMDFTISHGSCARMR